MQINLDRVIKIFTWKRVVLYYSKGVILHNDYQTVHNLVDYKTTYQINK